MTDIYSAYKNMSKQEVRRSLKYAKMRNDYPTVFLLLVYLDKFNAKVDSYSADRKKYQRVLCPVCNSSSHKIKGSVTEMRRCKQGHEFTFADINNSAIYKT
jgi:hypothetical protein